MKAMEKDWYKNIWSMDIQDMSWVEDTKQQVDFLIDRLELNGTERILDLACGFGRHALEFARRGYDVTGVDITPAYVEYAKEQACREQLNASFLCKDIRELEYDNEYDVVLNMADGAIGYLENDEENKRIFAVAARALRKGGRHFMDIMNGGYAESHFPCRLWDAGEKGLTLSVFEWLEEQKTLLYGQADYPYGQVLSKPEIEEGNPIRLYTLEEVMKLAAELGLYMQSSYADYSGSPSSDNAIQLLILLRK